MWAWGGVRRQATFAGVLQGDEAQQPLVVHFTGSALPAPAAAAAAQPPPPLLEPLVAAHAALQLVPDAWHFMQLLLGFFVEDVTAAPGGAEAGAEAGTTGLVYVRHGMPLREFSEQRPRGGSTLPPVEAVRPCPPRPGLCCGSAAYAIVRRCGHG